MCDEQERGDGWQQRLGGRTRRRWRHWEAESKRYGAILRSESACVSGADGLLSVKSWGVGAESFLVPGVARSLSHTSPLCLSSTLAFVTLYFVWWSVVSPVVSHFVNLFSYKTVFFPSPQCIYGLFCVVLGTSQKAAPDRRRMPRLNVKPNKSPDVKTGGEENNRQTMRLIRDGTIIHAHHVPDISGRICCCRNRQSGGSRTGTDSVSVITVFYIFLSILLYFSHMVTFSFLPGFSVSLLQSLITSLERKVYQEHCRGSLPEGSKVTPNVIPHVRAHAESHPQTGRT